VREWKIRESMVYGHSKHRDSGVSKSRFVVSMHCTPGCFLQNYAVVRSNGDLRKCVGFDIVVYDDGSNTVADNTAVFSVVRVRRITVVSKHVFLLL